MDANPKEPAFVDRTPGDYQALEGPIDVSSTYAHRDPFGNPYRRRQRYQLIFPDRNSHGGKARRLNSNHSCPWTCLFHRATNPSDETPAADGDDDCLKTRALLENFKAQRSLPRNNVIVV